MSKRARSARDLKCDGFTVAWQEIRSTDRSQTGRLQKGVKYVTITLYCDSKRRIVAEAIEIAPGNVGLKILEFSGGRYVGFPPDLDKGSGKFETKAEAESYARQWWEEHKTFILA